MDAILALASLQLERVKALCAQTGLKYIDLPEQVVGVGICVGFGENDYTICSIMGGGSESQLMTTSGILRDVNKDRDAALQIVNRFNQENTAYTVYLHEAEAGWSLLVQRTTPIEVFLEAPSYFNGLVRALPMAVQQFRQELSQETSLGGQPWGWTAQDHSSLLIRSML